MCWKNINDIKNVNVRHCLLQYIKCAHNAVLTIEDSVITVEVSDWNNNSRNAEYEARITDKYRNKLEQDTRIFHQDFIEQFGTDRKIVIAALRGWYRDG